MMILIPKNCSAQFRISSIWSRFEGVSNCKSGFCTNPKKSDQYHINVKTHSSSNRLQADRFFCLDLEGLNDNPIESNQSKGMKGGFPWLEAWQEIIIVIYIYMWINDGRYLPLFTNELCHSHSVNVHLHSRLHVRVLYYLYCAVQLCELISRAARNVYKSMLELTVLYTMHQVWKSRLSTSRFRWINSWFPCKMNIGWWESAKDCVHWRTLNLLHRIDFRTTIIFETCPDLRHLIFGGVWRCVYACSAINKH